MYANCRINFKSVFQMFLFIYLFIYFLNFRKSLEIFGSVGKSSKNIPDVIGTVANGSQELKSFGADFREVLKRTAA